MTLYLRCSLRQFLNRPCGLIPYQGLSQAKAHPQAWRALLPLVPVQTPHQRERARSSPLLAPRKRSHSKSWGDCSASHRKSTDWHGAGSGVQDGTGTSDPSPILSGKGRSPVLLTLASGHPWSPVLLREMPVSTVHVVCISQLQTSPAFHSESDHWSRAAPPMVPPIEQAAEPPCLLPLHPDLPLPVVGMAPILELGNRTSALGTLFSPTTFGAASAPLMALATLGIDAFGLSVLMFAPGLTLLMTPACSVEMVLSSSQIPSPFCVTDESDRLLAPLCVALPMLLRF